MASIFGMAGSLAVVVIVVRLDGGAALELIGGVGSGRAGRLVQVIVLVDLEVASSAAARVGLLALDGGRHLGAGHGQRKCASVSSTWSCWRWSILDEARSSADGQAVLDAWPVGARAWRWSLESDDLEAEAT